MCCHPYLVLFFLFTQKVSLHPYPKTPPKLHTKMQLSYLFFTKSRLILHPILNQTHGEWSAATFSGAMGTKPVLRRNQNIAFRLRREDGQLVGRMERSDILGGWNTRLVFVRSKTVPSRSSLTTTLPFLHRPNSASTKLR